MTPYWPELPGAPRVAAERRSRLVQRLESQGLSAAVITDARDILYFTGAPLAAPAPACLLLTHAGPEGEPPWSVLTCGRSDGTHHVDETRTYDWHTGGTIHADLTASMAACAAPTLRSAPARVGVQFESVPALLMRQLGDSGVGATAIDTEVADLQRDKDELELVAISAAVAADLAALEAAQRSISAGAREIEVFAAASRAATLAAGRRVHHDGDYRCGAPGGPPRERPIQAGELYIVDAWTQCAGYWADLARVYGVAPGLSPLQSDLIAHVASVHERIQPLLYPGVPCHDIWLAIDAALREFPPLSAIGLTHHGGHGIGLRLHEPPDIRRESPDVLRSGDIVCIEPGGYIPEARAGARVEQMYRITDRGPACLSAGNPVGRVAGGR